MKKEDKIALGIVLAGLLVFIVMITLSPLEFSLDNLKKDDSPAGRCREQGGVIVSQGWGGTTNCYAEGKGYVDY